MCGIAGILNRKGAVPRDAIARMSETMAHRGPDAQGIFTDEELAFGHRRLSIIDLSEIANQPMEDASGRYVIVFNGEIYNFAEIRPLLKDYPFRTKGDTEIILAGFASWGPAVLDRLRGMYSFAVWDRRERSLFMARDPLGVKPLYYYQSDDEFVFASELRTVLTLSSVPRVLDEDALAEYLRYQSIGYPYTPVRGVKQLKAGSWMQVKNGETSSGIHWQPAKAKNDFQFTDEKQVQHKVRELMLQSVRRRLVSDVPVAAFLSGGIDSSAVVGLMAEAGDASPNTFTVSFEEKQYDESAYASVIAKKFSTRHTVVRLRPQDMLEALPAALGAMDIPTGDGINTFMVSRAIHAQGIRVALSGAGGDELFAGYPIFDQYIQLQKKSWIWNNPAWLRRSAGLLLSGSGKKDRMRQLISGPGPGIADAYPVFRQLLSPAALHRLTTFRGQSPDSLAGQLQSTQEIFRKMPFYSQVTAAEYMGYTQATLLKDTDQMSMAHSLEIREPFFDQDLVEFVLAVPDHFKVPAYPKRLLVESLKPMIPDEIVHRKKQGFLFPWREWMKKDLKPFCDKHIRQMADRPFIHSDALKMMWLKFLSGDQSVRWQEIWVFVVLDHWLEKNGLS